MKQLIISLLSKELKVEKEKIENLIEIPPSPELGDYAFPCFSLSSLLKKKPEEIAIQLAEKLNKFKPEEIEKIEAKQAYINFFINKKILAEFVINKILKQKENFGKSREGKGKTIVFDMSSPNTAKPFGIGHLRSTIIGNSLSLIFKNLGYRVVKINYLGDWGTQFGRLIVGYKKFVNDEELAKNPIKHMLEIYVRVSQDESLDEESRSWFKKLETGDKEALRLWKKFRELSIKDFLKIYSLLKIKFDVFSGESFYNKQALEVIKLLEKKKLLKESQQAWIVDLEDDKLGICLIKKSDETTLYATRELAAAIDRYKKYKFDKMIYEVGSEQKLHFQQVFKILELLGYSFHKDLIHVDHGLYLDKDGKKLSTRKGKTIFMEDILDETIELAKKTIKEKNPELKNIDEAARKIAISAIFYGDLKNNRIHDVIFDIDKFLDFEGNTGPYLQYSYARASSILRKTKKKAGKFKIENLSKEEIALIKNLSNFPEIILQTEKQLNPSVIANYSFELAKSFNEFYHSCPVLNSKEENFRLALVSCFRIVIKSSLSLLGIDVLEEM